MQGYVKDNDIAAHSVDGESFYAVIHLQPSDNASMARCDKESWRKSTQWSELYSDKPIYINSFTRSRKSKDVEIVGAEI